MLKLQQKSWRHAYFYGIELARTLVSCIKMFCQNTSECYVIVFLTHRCMTATKLLRLQEPFWPQHGEMCYISPWPQWPSSVGSLLWPSAYCLSQFQYCFVMFVFKCCIFCVKCLQRKSFLPDHHSSWQGNSLMLNTAFMVLECAC